MYIIYILIVGKTTLSKGVPKIYFMLTKIDPRKTTLLEMRIVWLFLDARS